MFLLTHFLPRMLVYDGILHMYEEILYETVCWAGGGRRLREARGAGYSGRRPAAGRAALSPRAPGELFVVCRSSPSLSCVRSRSIVIFVLPNSHLGLSGIPTVPWITVLTDCSDNSGYNCLFIILFT